MKKLLALLLAILMCACVLVGCTPPASSGDGGQGNGGDTPTGTDDPNRPAPEVKDFGGYNFKIWNNSWCDYEIAAPTDLNGQGINDQVYNRNKQVEKLYNVTITEHGIADATTTESFNFLSNQQSAGSYFTDLFSCDAGGLISSLATNGFFHKLSDLPNLRLDMEWWDDEYIKETTINGYAYTFTGDIQTNDDLHERTLSMNNSLFEQLFPEDDIYKLIMEDDNWTLETFQGYFQNVGRDQGQKGVFESGDQLGFAYDGSTATYMFMACNIKTFYMENGQPVMNIDSDKAINLVGWLQKIVDGKGNFDCGWATGSVNGNAIFTYETVCQHFAAGQILFNTSLLADALKYYTSMEDDVYYLPFPKYDAEQTDYYNSIHFCFEPLAVSVQVLDTERTSLLTEALGFYSDKLEEEVMDILLQERLTNEVKPRELLLLTLDSKTYDMDYIASVTGFTSKINTLTTSGKLGEYSSTVASLKNAAINKRNTGTVQLFVKKYTQQSGR